MKKTLLAFGAASLAALAFAATVAAAGPGHGNAGGQSQGPAGTQAQGQTQGQVQAGTRGQAGSGAQGAGAQAATDVVASILGLTHDQIADLRQSGLSLAQIAGKQAVDPQKLVDALVAQWSGRIDYRVSVGALTAAQAATLKDQLGVRAKDMVYRTTLGGMQGTAVGGGRGMAGRGAGANGGMPGGGAMRGNGNGACDGTGPNAAPQP